MVSNGTAYSRENRVMIKDIKSDIKEMKESIGSLANHYSKRLPLWAVIIITLLSSLSVGLIVRALG